MTLLYEVDQKLQIFILCYLVQREIMQNIGILYYLRYEIYIQLRQHVSKGCIQNVVKKMFS